MEDEIQKAYALNDIFVINSEAFREAGSINIEIIKNYPYSTCGDLQISDKTISDLENIILSCSSFCNTDAEIDEILIEEMPAYFMNNKSLEEVTAIAQDRAQQVLDGRG